MNTLSVLFTSSKMAVMPQVNRGLLPHSGHVLFREQVQRSAALSLLSPGKQADTVWAVGSNVSLSNTPPPHPHAPPPTHPVTVMVISHPVFSPRLWCAIIMPRAVPAVCWQLVSNGWARTGAEFVFPPRDVLFLTELTPPWLLTRWPTMGPGRHQFLNHLLQKLNGAPLSLTGNT